MIARPQKTRRVAQTPARQQHDAATMIVARLIGAYGEEHGLSRGWFTRAEHYARYLLTGKPLGNVRVDSEIRELVRGFVDQACEEAGFKRPAPGARKSRKKKK
jgi:hypothetical protein